MPPPQICNMAYRLNKWISDFASLFILPEEQAIITEQRNVPTSDTASVMDLFNLSQSGVKVNENTALGISSLWRAVDLMASLLATMPKKLYRRDTQGQISLESGHSASLLIEFMLNDEYPPFDFWYALVANAYLRGGGGAEIIRNNNGRPVSLRLMRHGVTAYKPFKDSELIFYDNEDGRSYPAENVLYFPGLMVMDGTKAKSILTSFKDAFGEEISHKMMVSNFLKVGPLIGGVYTTARKLDDTQKQSISSTFGRFFGGAKNAAKIVPIGNGETFTQFKPLSFADAQMVDMKQIRIGDVARMFGIPVSLLMELNKPSYNSLEQLFKQFLITTLDPRVTRLDQELNRKLLSTAELGAGYYFESVVDELMWMDAKSRAEYWKTLSHIGAITPNEVRQYNNWNNVKGGDEPLVQMQLVPLSKAGKHLERPQGKQNRKKQKRNLDNPKQGELFENQKSDDEQEVQAA